MVSESRRPAQRPISGAQDVVPGPCPPEGCPEPTELVCIEVDKIYDACSQRHCFEDLEFCIPDECDTVTCSVQPGAFQSYCDLVQIQEDPPLVRATVDLVFAVSFFCDGQFVGTESVLASAVAPDVFPKSVILFGFADEMFCKIEPVFECLGCDIIGPAVCDDFDGEWDGECDGEFNGEFGDRVDANFIIDGEWDCGEGEGEGVLGTLVECDIGLYLEIKTAAHVDLLVPAYGFCPVPPECEELPTRCEEFLTGPPPRRFPPQPAEFAGDDS